MRRKIPPFAAVRAFEAVARHQHLGLAADELCVTHSALSQQIKHLEAWFGREMFIRQRGRLILNPSCQELVAAYSMALDVLQDATEEYERLDDSDFIKIVSDPAFFATCLIGGAREFAEALEGANVDIITLHDLGERFPPDADIVVHYRRPEGWEDSHSEKLMDLHGFPACAPSLLEGRRRPEVPDDLGEFLLLHGADRSTWY
ncbi:MAG: LysR family transcriptional regulator, partial [Shimia sp.]|nr:LysR family transcriptional regulator [Shimia sp.]